MDYLFYYFLSLERSDLNSNFAFSFSFSYVVGDTSILQEAGVGSTEDVEGLLPPPEVKDKEKVQKFPGSISYFICTRPGKGPILLSEDFSLINPSTGLPK